MKLELKHVQHYPIGKYGIQIFDEYDDNTKTLVGIDADAKEVLIKRWGSQVIHTRTLNEIKPIFHNLSDLTKPIKVEGYNNGKEFVPIEELKRIEPEYPLLIEDDGSVYFTDACILNMLEISRINKLFQLLYQWHFDLEGLIESDLAIDINTLNK